MNLENKNEVFERPGKFGAFFFETDDVSSRGEFWVMLSAAWPE